MTTSRFDQRVLIEQLRHIEAQGTLAGDNDDMTIGSAAQHDFLSRLWLRAKSLADRNELMSALQRTAILVRIANGVGLLVAAILGALATSLALSSGQTINIYWLLLLLLGFNFLSMLLWLVGISLKLDGLMSGMLAKITRWLPTLFREKTQYSTAADRAWLACHFGGRLGQWQLSAITHQLWLVYLLAGMALLVLVLIARQYHFVWGTTLLSDSAFVSLTEWLGRPLQALGLTTPTAQQVLQTRVGVEDSLSAMHSHSWAQFLLGALLVYGVLPRLSLWTWALLMRAKARRAFELDYYLPYYIALRRQLLPHADVSEIVDAANNAEALQPARHSASLIHHETYKVPADARWVAVEPGEDIDWPPVTVTMENDLGQVNDRQSLTRLLQRLDNEAAGIIAVAVTAARAPDRGVQRTISSILATTTQPWLVLMHQQNPGAQEHTAQDDGVKEQGTNEHGAVTDSHLGAWYRLAEACGVPADHVVVMTAV